MENNKIHDYLIESLKQINDYYKNKINAIHPFPCGICQKKRQQQPKGYIECSSCKYWIHIKYNGTSNKEYNEMLTANSIINLEEIAANTSWFCNKCQISNMAQLFPFGLQNNHDLQNIVNSDSLKFLENLPSYKTTSKAYSIDSLSQSDIDENIMTNINSRYYSANEFKTIEKNNSFNILH